MLSLHCNSSVIYNFLQALGEEVVKQIDELYKGITPDDESDVPMDKQIDNASQHLSEFFAASSKEFEGTTCILTRTTFLKSSD